MATNQDLLYVVLTVFLGISAGVLLKTAADVLRKGLQCLSAFTGMWVFAYVVPTLLYIVSPGSVTAFEGYAWMRLEEWALAALVSLGGLATFGVGYHLGRNKRSPLADRVFFRIDQGTSLPLTLLLFSLGLQLIPIYQVLSQGIAINFAHRWIQWQAVGLTIRFAFLALPSSVIACSLFLEKKTLARLALLILSLSLSFFSALLLGARMFVVLLPIALLLMYSNHKPRSRPLLFTLLLVVALAVPAGYHLLLRSRNQDLSASIIRVLVVDTGRPNTLAYTTQHAGWVHSDLVSPPILGSYFYWLILPVPRSAWPAKPYAANLQFSLQFRREHSLSYFPESIDDLPGRTEFGFIEEAMMNLGLAGFLIVGLLGYLGARIDRWIDTSRYLRIAIPLFFLLGTIYTFNGILDYLAFFLVIGLVLDRSAYVASKGRL